MVNDEKETKRRLRQTATSSIRNVGDAATATTTSDRDHHRVLDVAASIEESEDVDVVDVIEVVRLQHHLCTYYT